MRFTENITVKQLAASPRVFHEELDGETRTGYSPAMTPLTEFEQGFLVGILVGEGHFGGDGRQPQVTLRMHTRHEQMFAWLRQRFPDSRLYGPYHHGGRSYYQWMARGRCLREEILPLVMGRLDVLDDHVRGRIEQMIDRYRIDIGGSPETP